MDKTVIPERISLADASRISGRMLHRGASTDLSGQVHPSLQDLTECLFFSPGDGRIWLHDQRMFLLHSSSLGALRRELIDSLGLEKARGLLTRTGYVSGLRDARLVRQRWPEADAAAIFAAGTRLHSLEGVVQVETVNFEFDVDRGIYNGEFLWHHSVEDDEHIAAYGIGTEPACWMQLGYAIGYVSGLMGRLIIFREVECRSTGSAVCRVISKSAEGWGDIGEDLRYLNASEYASVVSRQELAAQLNGAQQTGIDDDKQLIGVSSAFNSVCHALKRVAPTQATVLFTGESGVGKELFAYRLHQNSPRRERPFVGVNCAAIPETLIESELFGVERGAYTGATVSRPGRFERADGGTLFLDEIGTLSLSSQGKLLRALQEHEIERVGGTRSLRVDVRVVAATNVKLREEVKAGRFREDLYFRLNVFPIEIPPLRERRDDIPLLIAHFLQRYSHRHSRRVTGLTWRAMKALLNYDYPGNIRELQNLIERGVIAADDDGPIDLPHLFRNEDHSTGLMYSLGVSGALAAASTDGTKNPTPLLDGLTALLGLGDAPLSLADIEARLLREAVERARGNLSAAARTLGLTRAQLAYRLQRKDG